MDSSFSYYPYQKPHADSKRPSAYPPVFANNSTDPRSPDYPESNSLPPFSTRYHSSSSSVGMISEEGSSLSLPPDICGRPYEDMNSSSLTLPESMSDNNYMWNRRCNPPPVTRGGPPTSLSNNSLESDSVPAYSSRSSSTTPSVNLRPPYQHHANNEFTSSLYNTQGSMDFHPIYPY